MKRRLNWKVLTLIALVALVAVVVLAKMFGKDKGVEVEVARAAKRTLVSKVSESGIIQPDLEVSIGPDVSGELVQIFVKEGDYVKKGQLLFTINPENFEAAFEQAMASYNSSRADYESAKASLAQQRANLKQDSINLDRNRKLREQGAISAQDFENARLAYEVSVEQASAQEQTVRAAYYRMLSSQASVKQSRESLQRTSVYASMDGVVTYLEAEVGQRVVGFGQMTGTEVLRIADLTRMEVKVEINENDIVNITLGDTADVEVDAFPDKVFKGIVTKIAYSSSSLASATAGSGLTTDQVTTYPVEILIKPESYVNDPELMKGLAKYQSPFRPGMSGLVYVYTNRAEDVWSVPIQSVTVAKEEGLGDDKSPKAVSAGSTEMKAEIEEIVYVVKEDGTVEAVTVKSGIADADYIQIKEGVSDSVRVVTGPYSAISKLLRSGTKVTVKGNGNPGGGDKQKKVVRRG